MLTNLYIKNYALFTECNINFLSGLNVLTGETGAGKSLLIGALGLLLGKRSDSSVMFHPDQKCIVEAQFSHLSAKILKDLAVFEDFDLEEKQVLIRREISPSGKTRVFVNDTPISVQVLKHVAAVLIDLHGQNESQLLLEPEKQMGLLDEYAETHPLLLDFKAQLQTCQKIQQEIQGLEAEEATAKQQYDYYQFQMQELAEADLQETEEEDLENELKLLQNSEEIREALRFSVEKLYNDEQSVYQAVSQILQHLSKVSSFDKTIGEETEKLYEFKEILKEMTFGLENVLETIEANPERLAFIEERLAVYHRLKRKYNVKTGRDLMAILEDYSQKIARYASIDESIVELKEQLDKEKVKLVQIGLCIEDKRKEFVPELEWKVNNLLKEVGFKEAKFIIHLDRNLSESGSLEVEGQKVKPNGQGINKLAFKIQTNPGLPIGLLSEIASGGEVSRVMLAIKTALADKSEFPVLIFDEIDTGISGEVAHKVGNVMHKLANRFQILSITHLPQIAAKGDNQYLIYKEIHDGTTSSYVRKLTHGERVMAIATMIGGENPSEISVRSAVELLR
ncbi:MAG: DNA repair protein RecN [Bacteroidia bacterium]